MGVQIKSGDSSDNAKVGGVSKGLFTEVRDEAGNGVAKAQREQIPSSQKALLVAAKNDDVAVMLRADRKGNLLMGNYVPEIIENFEGTAFNVQRWLQGLATYTAAMSTVGGYSFNGGNSLVSGATHILQSWRYIPKLPRVPLQFKSRLRHSMVAGAIADFGFGVPSSTTLVVPNGTMFRLTNSGTVQGVITLNGAEIAINNVISRTSANGNTVGGNLNMSDGYYTANYFVYDIIVDDDNAVFTIQDTSNGEIIGSLSLPVPNNQVKMWGATSLPIYHRLFTNSAPASAPLLIVTELQALSMDWRATPDSSQLAGSLGLSAGRQPFSGVPTENHTNSTAPTSATLSNVAAGYTTLGGRFQFAAVAGAVTDYALFGFTVPAGSRFLCEGIRIETYNTGAAVATTNTLLEWAMGFNSSAVSLATANIVRRQCGVQSFAVGAPIGAQATPIDIDFRTPEVVEAGRFLHVILNSPIGTATASQVIRGNVLIKGRFI